MESHIQKYEKIIKKVTTWAEKRSDLRVILVVGSRARKDAPADKWSDLDVVFFTNEPDQYLSSDEWISEIGPYWFTFIEETAVGGGKERRVLFEDAIDVDFSVFPIKSMKNLFEDPQTRKALHRGVRVLADKDGEFQEIYRREETYAGEDQRLINEDAWIELIHDFLYHAVWGAKKLLRREWWTAKDCIDHYLKQCLLSVAECHARAKYGANYDTWHNGRFFDQWADPFIQEQIKHCYAHYEKYDMQQALLHTIKLFRRMALETAELLNYRYPHDADELVEKWIESQFQQESEAQV
ncbi:aminoglycoside 6-adenylyltransferase [Halobacillus salinarum]|uniref:Aminoglycoside 6-adenylyltransferase n=1 Tax=Halobacillus salinarum TaxID=2932257 RepID=A0ABY4EN86_9BACI|nr:aminoglycoside 6-adenylyltransferase [Halobacillus salinarum]UOQ45923.1 aminoglycoside 6-adenylyltransferase [Halobacillus salinarum]